MKWNKCFVVGGLYSDCYSHEHKTNKNDSI